MRGVENSYDIVCCCVEKKREGEDLVSPGRRWRVGMDVPEGMSDPRPTFTSTAPLGSISKKTIALSVSSQTCRA